MLTLQTRTTEEQAEMHEGLQRLAPSLARAAAETAGAFFMAEASLPNSRNTVPRFSEFRAIRCSQKNVGERFEMICNLAVDQTEWNRLFTNGESEEIRRDAFSELANCICGAVLANPGFTDEFGFLIPCVPCSGPALVASGTPRLKGAFKMGAAWIRYSLSMHHAEARKENSSADKLTAIAA